MNVTVVCEHNASMDSEAGKRAYPEGLGVCLKEMLEEAGHRVTLVTTDENGAEGLTDDIIGATDVMFWWGHWHHLKVADEVVAKVADRALRSMVIRPDGSSRSVVTHPSKPVVSVSS